MSIVEFNISIFLKFSLIIFALILNIFCISEYNKLYYVVLSRNVNVKQLHARNERNIT